MNKKQILALVGGVAVAIVAALLKWSAMPAHPHPVMHDDLELAAAILGALGFVVPVSIFGASSSEKPDAPPPPAGFGGAGGGGGGIIDIKLTSARALLPLALVALTMSGCATAGGKALKACELAQLPAEDQALAQTVTNIALDSGSYVGDLEQLAVAVGSAQFTCVVQAVQAWLSNPAATAGGPAVAQALLDANVDVRRGHALQVLGQYLSAHPSACAARQAM